MGISYTPIFLSESIVYKITKINIKWLLSEPIESKVNPTLV